MINQLLQGDFGLAPTNLAGLVLGLLLALIGGHLLAWIYMVTHSGLSYSSSFTRSLVVMPVAVSLVMNVVANNLIVAFGMMAVFAIVRFRNLLRDTLDTTYILLVLVLGMATGSQKFTTAIVGLGITVLVLLYLWVTSFGTRRRFDLALHLQLDTTANNLTSLEAFLRRYTRKFNLTAKQPTTEQPSVISLSYLLLLRDPARREELIAELRALPGVTAVSAVAIGDELEM